MNNAPGRLLREARTRAGLSQRTLAQRAGTSQSVVARIELGMTSPTWVTLQRLVTAAGFALDVRLCQEAVVGPAMMAEVERILSLSVDERLAEVARANRAEIAAKASRP